MFSKFKKQLSFIMIFTLILQIVTPLTSLATNQSEQFNGENLILQKDGYIHTTIDEGKIAIIKTYTDDGILLEEVIIDRNRNNQAIHLDYNVSKDIGPTKTIINFEDYGITQKDDEINYQNSPRNGRYSLGRSTIRSHTPSSSYEYYYMDVTYDQYNRQGTYSVPSFQGTLAKGIAFFVGIINVPAKLAGTILGELAWAGIVTITGNMITMPFFSISARITEYTVYGKDSRDRYATGELYGTKAVINHDGSKYFNETFYDEVDIRDWGRRNITYGLISQAYPGLYMEMEVISER